MADTGQSSAKRINGRHRIHTGADSSVRLSFPIRGETDRKRSLQKHLMGLSRIN